MVGQNVVVSFEQFRTGHQASIEWARMAQVVAFGRQNKDLVLEVSIAHENVLNGGRSALVGFDEHQVGARLALCEKENSDQWRI